jgi:hypothetical protein
MEAGAARPAGAGGVDSKAVPAASGTADNANSDLFPVPMIADPRRWRSVKNVLARPITSRAFETKQAPVETTNVEKICGGEV